MRKCCVLLLIFITMAALFPSVYANEVNSDYAEDPLPIEETGLDNPFSNADDFDYSILELSDASRMVQVLARIALAAGFATLVTLVVYIVMKVNKINKYKKALQLAEAARLLAESEAAAEDEESAEIEEESLEEFEFY